MTIKNKILKPQIKVVGMVDAVEMAVMKTLSERALAPVIGNGGFKSGAIKLVAGAAVGSLSQNKHVGLLSAAGVMDGTEDIAHGIISYLTNAGGNTDTDGWS